VAVPLILNISLLLLDGGDYFFPFLNAEFIVKSASVEDEDRDKFSL
jgi:hypothetical protein